MRAELAELAEDVASWHPAPGEWCVKECLGHLIETESRGFAGRIRRILKEPGCAEQTWDQVQVQKDRGDDARNLRELLDAFSEVRAVSVQLVEGLMNTDLVKVCMHQRVGELSVEDLLHDWIYHDRNHHRQLLAVMQAYAWSSMGNARRFEAT